MWCIIAFFLCLGTTTLVAYMKIGYDHADRAGERYIPASAAIHQVSE
jgi:fumarate reductase subunit C